MNNLPKVVTRKREAGSRTRDLRCRKSNALTTTPTSHTLRPAQARQIPPPQVRSCGMDGEECLSQFSNFVVQVNCIHGAYAQLPHGMDPWDASPPTLEITGTKCVWSPSTFATIFVTFRSAPWEATFKGETERKVGK